MNQHNRPEKVVKAYMAVEKFVPRPLKRSFRRFVLCVLYASLPVIHVVSWTMRENPMIDFLRWVTFKLGI